MITAAEIATRLKTLRSQSGMTQDQFASLMGLIPNAVYKMETGRRNLKIEELVALSDALGFTVDEFLAGDVKSEGTAIRLWRAANELEEALTSAGKTLMDVYEFAASNPEFKAAHS